jgi:hypothetical protein
MFWFLCIVKLIRDTQKPILMEYEVKDNKIEFKKVL